MNKMILLITFFSCISCSTTYQTDMNRMKHTETSLIASVLRNVTVLATGGTFDTRRMSNEVVSIVSSEATSHVYDDYYSHVRETNRIDVEEREYQNYKQRRDHQDKELRFEQRYRKENRYK